MCRGASLAHFNDLFETLWKLSADSDLNVRSGAELLDRLLKDIVVASSTFDVAQLMVLIPLHLCIFRAEESKIILKKYFVAFIGSDLTVILLQLSTMLTAPQLSIMPYLPEVLDGLFQMLSDQLDGVRDVTETVLGQFLERLQQSKADNEVNLCDMINVLIVHSGHEATVLTRRTALVWLLSFVELCSTSLLPYLSAYLTAILPYLDDSELKANEINQRLMALLQQQESLEIKVDAVIDVLLKHIKHEKRETRMAVLNWIRHLHKTAPKKIFSYMDSIFPILLSVLLDTCDDVLLLDLQLLSDICEEKTMGDTGVIDIAELTLNDTYKQQLSNISPYLIKFALSLLKMFREDTLLMNERGVLIIRQLCLLLDPAHIYRCLSVLLMCEEENVEFVSQMVAMLNGILLTATELFEMRDQLRALQDEESVSLFECLYRSWAYQPIALLGLCILSQNYEHASELAKYLWRIDVTLEVLVEIDRLVQLIESPILAYVRLDLLSAQHQRPLASVLSALLMLLPQTDGFNTLHKRLQCIPALTLLDAKQPSASPDMAQQSKVNFEELLQHFHRITDQQRKSIRDKHRQLLISSAIE
ncbi:unnamed protein product [Anisakis simplex]|uniref:Protein VAC14 homolog n=1 Tax=Anisakis simplex TaxID=6269 RepID=A0A0M3KBB6_ANISI|nr:unnamed protein product [Anisakis simplex]